MSPRWLLPLLWTLLALCALAFAATWWWPFGAVADWLGGAPVQVEPLAPAAAPAARYGHEAGLIGDRDFALIADPDGLAAARDLDFHSWLAAHDRVGGAPLPGEAPAEADTPAAPAGEPDSASESEAEGGHAPG